MQNSVRLKAFAKLNLMLRINSVTDDGYHDMFMVNQSVSLFDELEVKKNSVNEINLLVKSENTDKPSGIPKEKNLVYKLAKLMSGKYAGVNTGMDITLTKKIPEQAGLAGGSADAAGMIEAIDSLYGLKLGSGEKTYIAKSIGADVPFCLFGGSKIVEGIGENLKDIDSDSFYYILIKPDAGMSTKSAFEEYDRIVGYPEGKFSGVGIKKDIRKIDITAIKECFMNDFEKIMLSKFSELKSIKDRLYHTGAEFAQMTGSGTTVFGLYDKAANRDLAFDILKKEYKNVYAAQTADKGVEIIYEG